MSAFLDLDDVCAGHPKAKEELEELRMEARKGEAASKRSRFWKDEKLAADREIARLEKECHEYRILSAQRGARMQVLREAMRDIDWHHFLYDHPEAKHWFDSDGVPVRSVN